MNKILSIILSALLLAVTVSCSTKAPPPVEVTSAQEPITSSSVPSSVSPSSQVSEPDSEADETEKETAVFGLGSDAESSKSMSAGDSIGDWTLDDLQIDYSNNNGEISFVEANFVGEVTLTGTIVRNGLVEYGYDFMLDEQDYGKMPSYLSPENQLLVIPLFMLNIPDNLANSPKLEHDEKMPCKITISNYHFIFAYMTAPSSARVVSIEPL